MKNKTLALALSASLLAPAALAADNGLSFQVLSSATRTESSNPAPDTSALNFAAGTSVQLGELFTTRAGTISFSYLGQESGYQNEIRFNGQTLTEAATVGSSLQAAVGAGSVDFAFHDLQGGVANNLGRNWVNSTSIALLGENLSVGGISYAMVLGFNDRGGAGATSGDWDDYVVGVNFTSAVPEPAAWLLLAGGLICLALRRQR
jgi:PEP-CTERM motif